MENENGNGARGAKAIDSDADTLGLGALSDTFRAIADRLASLRGSLAGFGTPRRSEQLTDLRRDMRKLKIAVAHTEQHIGAAAFEALSDEIERR